MSDPSDSQLDALLARARRDIAPAQDLWPDIEARASAPPYRPHRAWQIAAGIAATTLFAAIALHLWGPRAQRAAGTGLQDASYLSARAALEQSYRTQLAQLPPDTRTQIAHDLEVIQSARADIRRALASDPGSPLLNELMTTAWQQEIDLYREVAANATAATRRNL
jgi:hypothetical protein